ncbi:MAG: hypothetical protein JXB00_20305 [Bacteroidales bacterium]|nr:hypothetical protein [Bacteroidales bacterium]
MNIIFLHHSTGRIIWNGEPSSKIAGKIRNRSNRLANILGIKAELPKLMEKYNKKNRKNYQINEMIFPKNAPYGWKNYPYDYYNIWVRNAGNKPYMEEPTLELLTKDYGVIIFKHCFPVSSIRPDKDTADINSEFKSLSNYKLQYLALRDKLHDYPGTKFILFTGAALVESSTTEDEAQRANDFFHWVKNEWDTPNDNIYLWDLYALQTEDGLYFKDEYAASPNDSHPNAQFAGRMVKLLFNRIIDVIENNGSKTRLNGEPI